MVALLIYRFLESYFRHRWLYLLPIVVMCAAAGIYIANMKPKYVASGSLYVQMESFLSSLNSVTNNETSWWATPAQVVIGEMNELLKTDAFIRAIIHETNLEEDMDEGYTVVSATIEEVRENIRVEPLGDNQLMISASHEDPLIAYQITNSMINSFIQWQVNAQRIESEAAQTFFANLIKEYEADLDKARAELVDYLVANPPPLRGERTEIENMEISRLQGAVELARSRYTSALEKEENARLALAQIESDTRQSYTIIDAPLLPERPDVSRKDLAIQLGIFLAIGVILSAVAIAGNMIIDRSFRFPIDVYYGIHLPVLAMIPDTTVKYTLLQRIKMRLFRKKPARPVVGEGEASPEAAPQAAEPEPQAKPSLFRRLRLPARTKKAQEPAAPENGTGPAATSEEVEPAAAELEPEAAVVVETPGADEQDVIAALEIGNEGKHRKPSGSRAKKKTSARGKDGEMPIPDKEERDAEPETRVEDSVIETDVSM
jgi:capsular polysaccharide biosynthesis protein